MGVIQKFFNLPFGTHLVIATIIRLFLILYGQYQDQVSIVPYTDVDYKVFTDAARHILNDESPYQRHTYRYSPILAILLIPNILLNRHFGKFLFSLADILVGVTIKKLVRENKILAVSGSGKPADLKAVNRMASHSALFWLYNPLAVVISTRGNADSLSSLFVLMSLLFHQTDAVGGIKKYALSGGILGLAIHFRIYPLIYSLPMFIALGDYKITQNSRILSDLYQLIPNRKQILFTLSCLATLTLLTVLFYRAYGYVFLYETFMYHMLRKDTRHNFSLFFYVQYLTLTVHDFTVTLHKTIPQVLILTYLGMRYGRMKTLNFAVLGQTVIFVAYNSVITSQYFIWFLSLIPLCISDLDMTRWKAFFLCSMWAGSQSLWLIFGYSLEFEGHNAFNMIWLQGVVFFFSNLYVLADIVLSYTPGYMTVDDTDKIE